MDDYDRDAAILRKHAESQQRAAAERVDRQRRFEDAQQQRDREYDERKQLSEKKQKFFDACMQQITASPGRILNNLYEPESHRNEIRGALEFIFETSFSSWKKLHAKDELNLQSAFASDVFRDMFLGNLQGKADHIIQSLESPEFKTKFREHRERMKMLIENEPNLNAHRRIKNDFYKWRSAFIGDMIFDHAINTVLDHLEITDRDKPPIRRVLRNGQIHWGFSEKDRKLEDFFDSGHLVTPKRNYLLHNSDMIKTINTMNEKMDGRVLPTPLLEGSKLGMEKQIIRRGKIRRGNTLEAFGLKV